MWNHQEILDHFHHRSRWLWGNLDKLTVSQGSEFLGPMEPTDIVVEHHGGINYRWIWAVSSQSLVPERNKTSWNLLKPMSFSDPWRGSPPWISIDKVPASNSFYTVDTSASSYWKMRDIRFFSRNFFCRTRSCRTQRLQIQVLQVGFCVVLSSGILRLFLGFRDEKDDLMMCFGTI